MSVPSLLVVLFLVAAFYATSARAQFDHQWGVRFRPGCEMLGCQPIPGGRRCHWRCPRRRPPPPVYTEPDPPSYAYEPPPQHAPTFTTRGGSDIEPGTVVVLGLVGLVLLGILAAVFGSNDDTIEKDIEDTHALTKKLEADAREADARIAAFFDKMQAEDGGRDG